MPRTVTQQAKKPKIEDYEIAVTKWEGCKPPYTSSHIQSCVTAAKTILSYTDKPRRSKYEKDSYLRIDFSKAGKVTFYAKFPNKMGLAGKRLGEWPEMHIDIARERAAQMAAGSLKGESVHYALKAYDEDLQAKVQRHKLSEASYYTYSCRIKQLYLAFGEREVFSNVTYERLIKAIDEWIETKTNNHALELFAELRRFWKFSAPTLCNGRNIAASMPDDYVSSRVQRPAPTRLYTDIDAIAELWLNVSACTSVHQKNAIRYMILTGVRPINVCNLQWSWVKEDLSEIIYPATVIGMRGAMKTEKEFRIPTTPAMQQLLKEQKDWRDAALPNCNADFVFLQPRNPMQAFAKRSLDKLIKTHSPADAVKGITHKGTVKGSAGAFNTMCRKFLKSNIIVQMRQKGYSRSDTREISQLCLHHSDKHADPMAEHYDFSDEITQEELALKKVAFTAHEESILSKVHFKRLNFKNN
ncbi:recombinase [Veronia pacifica]|uniref:Recombinase n=1 Tax=Veronia pacifica TaxID=1080227 RepID=A0A1C3EE89_9GAMM|nr:recombinase [Veronia pacifica]ODA31539.1 recombinase [Veronia pacifica]